MGTGKKKIEIKRVEKEDQRMVTFSKRRQGLFKKAQQLHCLTGTDIAVLVFSPAGRPYTHGDPSFDATVDRYLKTSTPTTTTGGGDDNWGSAKSWLESVRVEDLEKAEELVLLKKKLEEIREKIVDEIDERLVHDFFASC